VQEKGDKRGVDKDRAVLVLRRERSGDKKNYLWKIGGGVPLERGRKCLWGNDQEKIHRIDYSKRNLQTKTRIKRGNRNMKEKFRCLHTGLEKFRNTGNQGGIHIRKKRKGVPIRRGGRRGSKESMRERGPMN